MISVISIHFEFIFNMSNFTFSFQSQTYYQVLNPKLFFILISVKRAGYCYPQHIHGVNPVSYTHLDVYKRQVFSWTQVKKRRSPTQVMMQMGLATVDLVVLLTSSKRLLRNQRNVEVDLQRKAHGKLNSLLHKERQMLQIMIPRKGKALALDANLKD